MNKKYWLRWGILFALVSITVGILLMISGDGGSYLIILTHGIAMLPVALPLVGIFGFQTSVASEDFFAVLFGTITYFIVGMILGWIYEKFKNRNRTE